MRCRPVILELTDGKPQLREGVLIYEDWEHNNPTGGRLHSAREDWGHDSARFEVRDGRILCDQFLTFTYLDDVNPGDGGLACKDTRYASNFRPREVHLFCGRHSTFLRRTMIHGRLTGQPSCGFVQRAARRDLR